MDEQHKKILVSQRVNLVENINPRDGLFTQLISRKVFSSRNVRTIQFNRTPDAQVEELLNLLPGRGPEAFSKFCQALKDDEQEHVLEFLKCDDANDSSKTGVTASTSRGEVDVSLKRTHSPEILCIRDGGKHSIKVQYIPSGPHEEDTRSPEKRSHMCTDGHQGYKLGEARHALKHWITDPGVVHIGSYVPVLPFEDILPALSSIKTRHMPPFDLTRCDSLDGMEKPVHASIPGHPSSDTIDCDVVQIAHSFDETEDAQIDLTDGPVSVKVDHTTRQFYLAFHRKSYTMHNLPRGNALIINVNEVVNKPPRRGTNIDRDNMHNLLKQLHFEVTVYNDSDGLTAQDMVSKLKQFASLRSHVQSHCCVICLLSHGEEGYVFGTDGKKIQLDEIFMMFDNTHCQSLVGKPKVFFIQACRGDAFDPGVHMAKQDETDGGHVTREPSRQMPSQSDMVICYPTQFGYYAWRNRERGSWYIEAVVQIFMRHAKSEDICTMLNRVNLLVSRKVSKCPQIEMDRMTQMSEYKSTLRRPHLFFFPGIGKT